MKKIVKILAVEKRKNLNEGDFYLSLVELDDGEEYSLAGSQPPKAGEMVENWFDDKYGKPKARYPLDTMQ